MLLGKDWIGHWKTMTNHSGLLFPGIKRQVCPGIVLRIDMPVSKYWTSSTEVHMKHDRDAEEKIF